MATVSKEFTFEAAHRLTSREAGSCGALHGHHYCVRVTVSGPIDPETGMVMNFRELNFVKDELKEVWDHALLLNKGDPLRGALRSSGVREVSRAIVVMSSDPTAENIARELFKFIEGGLGSSVVLESVTVHETAKCSATVTKEDLRDG